MNVRIGASKPTRWASPFTPSMASATGTSALTTRLRSRRSSATSRRRPPSSSRWAMTWSIARSRTSVSCARCISRSGTGPSSRRRDKNLYGRFDLSYDGRGPAKLLEYNADTPTAVFETAVFQWQWLEQAIARRIVPKNADQYNSLHERLIEGWKSIGQGSHLH